MSKLRVAVAGLGMGRMHVRGWSAHPNAEVVAVCDLDESRCRSVQEEFHVSGTYSDLGELLATEKPDVVSIATPNFLHKPYTLQALEAGAHVLCEKPIAMNTAEGREMIAAAEKAGKRLMVNLSYRFTSQSQALKHLVESDVLGEVYCARSCWLRRWGFPKFGGWFTDKSKSGGGPLIDLGVHRIDLALWLMGYPQPLWVMGHSTDVLTQQENARTGAKATIENHASGMVRFEGGACLLIEASWACHRPEQEFMETHLYGNKAGLVQKNRGGGYDFTAELYESRPGGFYDSFLSRSHEPQRSSMEHFAEAILNDTPTPAPAEDALKVQEILDGLYRSAETGEPVKIEA